MKRAIQLLIRRIHLAVAMRPIPERIGVYFHALEAQHWDQFTACIAALRELGYAFVGPNELICDGSQRRAFMSFDDNYRSWYEALDLFDALKIRATFYVNTLPTLSLLNAGALDDYYDRVGHRGARNPLNPTELRALRETGHTIGNHTHSHHVLSDMPFLEAVQDIRLANQHLRELTGATPEHFSYPFGMRRHFSTQLRSQCMAMGFATIANAIPGVQHRGHRAEGINRTVWLLDAPVEYNIENLSIDARLFERFTGRSAAI